MRNVWKMILICLLPMFINGCSTGRIESTARTSGEAILIGKLNVINQGNDVSKSSSILFDETAWGTYGVVPDSKRYFYLKLPIGNHYLSRLNFEGDKSINMTNNYITLSLPESKIYYCGDLTFTTDLGTNMGSLFGAIGAISYETRDVDMPPLKVDINYEAAKNYFNAIITNREEIEMCILKIDTSQVYIPKAMVFDSVSGKMKTPRRKKN